MYKTNVSIASDNRIVLGCFEVDGSVYAIDVSHLREIVRWQPVAPLPRSPELIEGVVDLRDSVIPVVDLGRLLAEKSIEPSAATRILIADVDGLALGLVVDAMEDVLTIDAEDLDDPPALTTHAGYKVTRAIVRRPDQLPILVLSADHILESVYRSALVGEEGVA